MKKHLAIFFLSLFSLLTALEIETIYGKMKIDEPILVELIESNAVQRLKNIDQHGHAHLKSLRPSFSRYDHTIGVLQLLRLFDAPLQTQVAGLVHDVSHTVFSHVSNLIFDHVDGKDSYQDTIHDWHLRHNGIEPILKKHKMTVESVCTVAHYPLLEQDLPDISAHRLEYILRTAYVYGFITTSEIGAIINDVKFNGEKWFFRSQDLAEKVGNLSLYFTENLWGAEWNYASHIWLSKSIKRALDLGIITSEDIHHQTDDEILGKLQHSKDALVREMLEKSIQIQTSPSDSKKTKGQCHASPKFRGINPWVEKEGKFVRLCDCKPSYAEEYSRVRLKMAQGYFFDI